MTDAEGAPPGAPGPADARASAPTPTDRPAAPTPAPTDRPGAPAPSPAATRRRLTWEIWLVLGVSLLGSATLAILNLVDRLTIDIPLGDQSATLNPPANERPWLDLLYQLRRIAFLALPAFLALYLLSANGRSAARRIGLDLTRPWKDLRDGVVLAALVGIPGLGVYAIGRALGITVEVRASGLDGIWWTVPVLILAALANALVEEVVVVGYLAERLRELRWQVPAILVVSALLRGSYHLYQGPGMAIGNVAMGVLFAWYYLSPRWGHRVLPLVIAHTLIDVVAFVGYQLLPEAWLTALGLA